MKEKMFYHPSLIHGISVKLQLGRYFIINLVLNWEKIKVIKKNSWFISSLIPHIIWRHFNSLISKEPIFQY